MYDDVAAGGTRTMDCDYGRNEAPGTYAVQLSCNGRAIGPIHRGNLR